MTAAQRQPNRWVEQEWTGLNGCQADGTECVICERNFGVPPGPREPNAHTPVGISRETGSQVFACVGLCAAFACPH